MQMQKVLFILALCAVLILPVFASDSESQAHQTYHPTPLPTIETAAATDGSFGNSTVLVPIWKGIVAEGLWYHSQGRNIGFVGGGYAFRPHHSVILLPSIYGVKGGKWEHDTVALGFRTLVETRRYLADISVIRTFGGKNGEDHDVFVDPSHISARIGKIQAGYAVEFFRHTGNGNGHSAHSNGNELLHGPRVGWEASSRMHLFYAALYKGGNHWEHKTGVAFFFADLIRKKK